MRFSESAATSTTGRIDRENAIVYGVKILGTESRNGRRYPPEMLARYKDRYENARVHLDHAGTCESRSVTTCFGAVRNIEARPDGLYADLVYNSKHPNVDQILNAMETFPENFGFSPNHEVEMESVDGVNIITKVIRVLSVDLVDTPATTNGIFEEEKLPNEKDETMDEEQFWAAMTLAMLKEKRPDLVEAIVKETTDAIDKENDFLADAVCSDTMDDPVDAANA